MNKDQIDEKNVLILEQLYRIYHPKCPNCGKYEKSKEDLDEHVQYECWGKNHNYGYDNIEFIIDHYQTMNNQPFSFCEVCGIISLENKEMCDTCEDCNECIHPDSFSVACEFKSCPSILCFDCSKSKFCNHHRCHSCDEGARWFCGQCCMPECGKEINNCCNCNKNDNRCISCLKRPCSNINNCSSKIRQMFNDETPFDENIISSILIPFIH